MDLDETATVDTQLLGEIAGLLGEVTGEDRDWTDAITPATRLEDDLRIESAEVTALAQALHARYGDRVDLPAYLAELDIDQLIALTVGDLVTFVARQRAGG